MRPRPAAVALALATLALAGCGNSVEAPAEPGVCFNMVKDSRGAVGGQVAGRYRFYVVRRGVADLEHCAAALDAVRMRFLALGGSFSEVAGAYQGEFLFLDGRGAFAATTLGGAPFPLLRRIAGGRLVPPSAPPEP